MMMSVSVARRGGVTRKGLPWISAALVVIPLTTIVSHSFGRATYPLLLPAIRDDLLAGSDTVAGAGGTVIYLAYLIGVTAVSYVSMRFDPVTILRSGVSLAAVGLVCVTVANGSALLMLGLGLLAGAGAGIWLTAPTIATDGLAPQRRGVMIGFLSGSIGFGTSIIALATGRARAASGNDELWRPIYASEVVATLVILALVVLFVKPLGSRGAGAGGFSLDALRKLPRWGRVTGAYVCFGAVASGFSTFLAAALEDDVGLSRGSVSRVYIAMGFASVIGAPFMGWISDRIGRRTAMIGVLSMMSVGSLLVAFGSKPVVVVGIIAFGGMWSSYPTLTATFVRDHLEAREFSSAFSTMTIFYGFAAILPPVLIGILADRTGSFGLSYVLIAVLALAASTIARGIPGRLQES
jgi:MFS family permease